MMSGLVVDTDGAWRQRLPRFSRGLLREFELYRALAEGSGGGIYLARHTLSEQPVVLRVLGDLRVGQLARFDRAAPALRALDHPRLLHIVDARIDGKLAVLATEVARGRSLARRVRACTLREALEAGARAAAALAHLHERGLVHGELRPSSLFASADLADLRVGDVGGTGVVGALPRQAPHPVLAHTAAPELVVGQEPGPASDQYALATIVYHLISHAQPFDGRDPAAVAQARVVGEPTPLRRVCPALPLGGEDAIMRALSREAGARFPDVAEFGEALARTARELGMRGAQVFAVRPSEWAPAEGSSPGELEGLGHRKERAEAAPLDLLGQPPGDEPLDMLLEADPTLLPPPRRARPPVAGRVLFALAGIALVLWATALRGPALRRAAFGWRARGEAARPAASAAPHEEAPAVHASWPAHRRLVATLAAPAGAPVEALEEPADEARFGSRVAGTLDAARRVATFDGLLPDRTYRLVAGGASLGTVRTPRAVRLRELTVLPADTAVLVDFRAGAALELSVEVGREGEERPLERLALAPGQPAFHALIGSLRPATRYWLRVRSAEGWGGLAKYPFATLPAEHAAKVEAWLRAAAGAAPDLVACTVALLAEPDARALGPAAALCERSPDVARLLFESLATLAGALRSPELVAALRPLLPDGGDAAGLAARASLAHAAWLARSALAGGLAHEVLEGTAEPALLARAAPALEAEGAAGCDLVARAKERVAAFSGRSAILPMVHCDPARAREHFLRWLNATSGDPGLQACAILGLELLGEEADVERLGALLSRAERPGVRVMAAEALAQMRGRRAQAVLRQAFQWDPERPELMWAAARTYRSAEVTSVAPRTMNVTSTDAGRETIASMLERLLRSAREPDVRRDAALALGLVGAGTDVLAQALDEREPAVVDGAAWAMARLGERRAVPQLLEQVRRADGRGVAAFALGRLDATEAIGALTDAVRRRAPPYAADAQVALGLRAWALGSLRARDAARDLAALADDAAVGEPTRALAREAVVRCWGGRSADTTLALLPLTPYERTGLALAPGDVVDITVSGWWVPPSGGRYWKASDRFSVDDSSSRCLVAQVGSQVMWLDHVGAPCRLVAEEEGELMFTPYGSTEGLQRDSGRAVPRARLLGLAVLRIERVP